ncbi:hypothetical protein BABL1_gene_125 [Candidatus Babela massiliensis]|uniref:Uncharacterized protein n=1 Tax=Candidatus Babela massiliensis TaxID=673862 RepID=V6DHG5_9BACT|nr:hypothetical protein BABL1_gene_125 [Candidatus Babela massiliensis]
MQDNFVRLSNNCLISLIKSEDAETCNRRAKLAKYVLDLSNTGQTCLASGDVQTAQVAWQKLLDLIS